MNAKILTTILSTVACVGSLALAQTEVPGTPSWQVTLHLTDENGNPIADANAYAGYYVQSPDPGAGARKTGLTDINGLVSLTAHTGPSIWYGAEKGGYYSAGGIEYDFQTKTNGQWQPLNPTLNLVLKRVGNPIPMYARRAQIEVPVVDKPVGFDLVDYDWVAPYGGGKHNDISFEAHRKWAGHGDFDVILKVAFSDPGSGLIMSPTSSSPGSTGPRISVMAPLDGYMPGLQRELSNKPIGGWKDDSKAQNYYLRVRTVLDENGNVKSALYGKIYGDFTLDPINSKTTLILFTYYLNPTPNDRNVEFDPNQNLFRNLPAMQQVKDP